MFIGIRGGFPWRRVPRAEGEGSYAVWGRFASDATARERSEWRRGMGWWDSQRWFGNIWQSHEANSELRVLFKELINCHDLYALIVA
jgi:hypothetical protein